MAIAKKLPSGSWRCRASYTDEKGERKSKSFTASTKREAESLAAVFLTEREHDNKAENITLGQLADRYIETRSNLLSPTTIAAYKKIKRNAFLDLLDVRVGMLTKQMYQKAINSYAAGRTYKTVANAHAFYNTVLKENSIYIGDKVILPQKDKKEITIPTTEELNSFLSLLEGSRLELYVMFAVYLGLRRSEIFALKWKDIDISKKTISINKAKVKNEFNEWVEKKPKTFSGNRKLIMPDALIKQLPPVGEAEDSVIQETPDALASLYNRAIVKANFPYSFHSLRHYYASIMLAKGVPNKYARERMGHATDNMLNKVYQHTMKDVEKEIDKTLNDFFDKEIKPEE